MSYKVKQDVFFYISLALDEYKDCHIASRPASALVTGEGTSAGMIKKYQNMFKGANIEDLRNARMVSGSTESLEEYNDTIYKYVEPYAHYYKAAQMIDTGTVSDMFPLLCMTILLFLLEMTPG